MILIDSNVLIDLFGTEQDWYRWSIEAVESASMTDQLLVNPISIAEVAPYLGSLEKFLENIATIGAEIVDLSHEAAFAAGRAFQIFRERRRSGGESGLNVLPDFFIGGHAQMLGASILTRDPRFYRAYFPTVPLISPSKDEA